MNLKPLITGGSAQERPNLPFVRLVQLSERELEVLKLLVEGHSNPEIATALYLSTNTIKTHVRNIMNQLGVERRTQIAVRALQLGLI
ncbi:MAG: response regulator transcription factor [Leptolyngbya sp. BL-A-14]